MKQFDDFEIRLIEEKDFEKLFKLINSNVSRLEDFFAGTVAQTKTLEHTKNFVTEILERNANKTYYPFIIIDQLSKEIIGFIDVKNIDWNVPKSELGCFIDNKYSNKKISFRAMKIVIDYLFTELEFKKLFLRTHSSNLSAQKLAENCGFEKEGIIRRDYKTTKGEIVDLIYYGMINN